MSLSSALGVTRVTDQLAEQGRYGDTRMVHARPATQALLRALGGAGTKNPATGMPEFYGADVINAAYMDIFGREPDAAGAEYYQGLADNEGWTESQLRGELQSSPEAQVRSLYRDVLGRNGDQAGVDYYVAGINERGYTPDTIRHTLTNSPEAQGVLPWADFDNNRLPDTQGAAVNYGFAPSDAVTQYYQDNSFDPGGQAEPAPDPAASISDSIGKLIESLKPQPGAQDTTGGALTRDDFMEMFRDAMAEFRPQYDPMAQMMQMMQTGGMGGMGTMSQPIAYSRRTVLDRDTGLPRYVDVPITASSAGGNIDAFRASRRNGFGQLAM